jgi:ribosomal protein S18 acetylase RimI-like enzyme
LDNGSKILIRPMTWDDVTGVVALQPLAFPPPFDPELHWDAEHILRHVEIFPEGQFVAVADGQVVASCSNTLIDEAHWQAHGSWYRTVGGPALRSFAPDGTTLYGLDIAVHPEFRRLGIGRRLYQARYDFVRARGLTRYGTGCRLPDFWAYANAHPGTTQQAYAEKVVAGELQDRTLTPLLRMGLTFVGVVENYMEDAESGDAGALLEWVPG